MNKAQLVNKLYESGALAKQAEKERQDKLLSEKFNLNLLVINSIFERIATIEDTQDPFINDARERQQFEYGRDLVPSGCMRGCDLSDMRVMKDLVAELRKRGFSASWHIDTTTYVFNMPIPYIRIAWGNGGKLRRLFKKVFSWIK
jgi:hypothetical protein